MIKCPDCQKTQVANTIFCQECGRYLLDDQSPDTDQIDDASWLGDRVKKPRPGLSSQPEKRPQAIRLVIGTQKREIEVPLNEVIHLGRLSPSSNVYPEIDLSNDVVAKSVSRRHARIFRQGNSVVVEDLGSFNGTFVNGDRLVPYLPEKLNDGDTLQLGQLLIAVKISAG